HEGGPVRRLVARRLRLRQQQPDRPLGRAGRRLLGRGAPGEREQGDDGGRDGAAHARGGHALTPSDPLTRARSSATASAPRTSAAEPSSDATTWTGPAVLGTVRCSSAVRSGPSSASPASASCPPTTTISGSTRL